MVSSDDLLNHRCQGFIYNNAYASWLSPNRASLAFAISFILRWLFFMWLLYRKNIIIKV
jgi:predicted acyltransferase